MEHRDNVVGEFEQNNHGTQDVNHRHKRHDKLRDTGNAVDTADDDQAGEYRQSNADSHRRNIESQFMAEAMELDWVALPMKPSAIIKAMEKKPDRKRAAPRPIFGVRPCVM